MNRLQLTFILLISFVCIQANAQNNSLFLPGAVNYVAAGDLDVAGDQLTVEALIQYTGASVNIVSKHTNPSDVNYLLRIGSFEITTTAGFANFGGVAAAGVTLNMGETYHVAATYNGQFLRYYVNGCLTGEMAWTGNMVQNNLITAIGQQSVCQCEQFTGYLDEVRIWNVARTQQEIADNMFDLPNPTAQAGLQAYYKFDGNFLNVQGNAAWNGTPVGAPQFQPIPDPLPNTMYLTASSSDVLCSGEQNGVINLAASGAYEPYEYSIDGVNYVAQNNFNGLPAGNYTVTARPQNNPNCAVSQTVVINDPDPILDNLSTTDVSCFGGNDGIASVSPQGGNGPDFSVEWTPNGETDNQIEDLTAGNYSVSIEDSCKSFGDELVVNGHFENGNNGFNTDYTLGTTGPTLPDELYAIASDPSNYHSGFIGAGFGGGGNFLVANGSTNPNQSVWCQTIPVTPDTYYNFSAAISSMFAVSPAQMEVTINGVPLSTQLIAPAAINVWDTFSDSWYSDNATQAVICITNLNLQANGNDFGLDNISFKECASCEEIIPVVINEPQPLVLDFTFVEESCGGANDGEIVFQVTGGTQPYQYSIDGGTTFQTTPNFTNLPGGNYDLVVIDGNNCQEVDNLVLPLLPPINYDVDLIDLNCFASNDGEISITNTTGGTAPYNFSINGGVNFFQNGDFTDLVAGSYDLVIEDDNGCQNTQVVTINEPDEISFTLSATDLTCFESEDGSISINNLQGGTGLLESSIDQVNYSQTNTYTDLPAGSYTISVVDANGCEQQSTIPVIQPDPLTFDVEATSLNCHNDASGQIVFPSMSGGVGGYSFSIDNGASFQSDINFANLDAGIYDLVMMDANNCTVTGTIEVTQPLPLSLTSNVTDATCFDACDGVIAVVGEGGTQPYSVSWDNGMNGVQAGNLCRGTYEAQVIDANGCQAEITSSVDSPPQVIADFYFWDDEYTILNPRIDFYNSSSGAEVYTWTFGDDIGSSADESPSFLFPDEPGVHEVELIAYNENNCSDTVVAMVEILDEIIYFVPNTFTPDGDGFNEGFKPIFTSGYEPWDYNLLIFNRWGQIVFESNNANLGWDGFFNGKIAPEGTYIWKIEFLETMSDKRHVVKGHVNLLK
jgi:gliding motility-associated-like protein